MATEPDLRKPFVEQLGMGVDLIGGDPTTAARRAVEDAIGRNRLSFRHQAEFRDAPVAVRVTVAVPDPEAVEVEQVRAAVPGDDVLVALREGGLRTGDAQPDGPVVVAIASVVAGLDMDA